jgi:large subunit ribosomal protein L2
MNNIVKIVQRKPRNASLRFQSYLYNSLVSKKNDPEKTLTTGCLKKAGGRNAYGRITVRHRGGGADRKYRIIDFKRTERSMSGVFSDIQYDPNRNVPIALIFYNNGSKAYILLPEQVIIGSVVSAGVDVEAVAGNALPLRNIPVGFQVHNIELRPNGGGVLVRGAGTSAQLVAKENDYAIIKLPSGETRLIHLDCWATVGVLANAAFKNITIGKAGRNRNLGKRPSVRGMAMNPVDHPHGGGEGRSKSGSHPRSPWGKCAKGTKTRKRVNRFILKRRK